jgi:subtilisin-like proprotein convertase family protein
MVLLSNAFYGESAPGTWTIKVVDGAALDTGTLTGWGIRIFGH